MRVVDQAGEESSQEVERGDALLARGTPVLRLQGGRDLRGAFARAHAVEADRGHREAARQSFEARAWAASSRVATTTATSGRS